MNVSSKAVGHHPTIDITKKKKSRRDIVFGAISFVCFLRKKTKKSKIKRKKEKKKKASTSLVFVFFLHPCVFLLDFYIFVTYGNFVLVHYPCMGGEDVHLPCIQRRQIGFSTAVHRPTHINSDILLSNSTRFYGKKTSCARTVSRRFQADSNIEWRFTSIGPQY